MPEPHNSSGDNLDPNDPRHPNHAQNRAEPAPLDPNDVNPEAVEPRNAENERDAQAEPVDPNAADELNPENARDPLPEEAVIQVAPNLESELEREYHVDLLFMREAQAEVVANQALPVDPISNAQQGVLEAKAAPAEAAEEKVNDYTIPDGHYHDSELNAWMLRFGDLINVIHAASGLLEFGKLFAPTQLTSAVRILGPDSKAMALTYEDFGGLYADMKSAQTSKLHKNSKMAWFWAEMVTSLSALSAGIMNFSVGQNISFISSMGHTAAASSTVAIMLPFLVAPVLLVSAGHKFSQAWRAHKKMDPLYLLEDRIAKYKALVVLDARDGQSEKTKHDRERYLHQIDALYQTLASDVSQRTRLAELIARDNSNQRRVIASRSFRHQELRPAQGYGAENIPTSQHYIRNILEGPSDYQAISVDKAKHLAHTLHAKQHHKKEHALSHGTTLALLGAGILLSGLSTLFPPLAIGAAVLYGVVAVRTMKMIYRNNKARTTKRDVLETVRMKLYSKDTRVKNLVDEIKNKRKWKLNPLRAWKQRKERKALEKVLDTHIKNLIVRHKQGLEPTEDVLDYVSEKGRDQAVEEFCFEHAESGKHLRQVIRGIKQPSELDSALQKHITKPENVSSLRQVYADNVLFDRLVDESLAVEYPELQRPLSAVKRPRVDTVLAPNVAHPAPGVNVGLNREQESDRSIGSGPAAGA